MLSKTSQLRAAMTRYHSTTLNYVPKHDALDERDVELLRQFVGATQHLLIVTGAGISTESGIPDYRSEGVGLYARTNHKPIQYVEFLRSAEVRKRYWARNYVAWPRFSTCRPNVTHETLRAWQLELGLVSGIVTQNVDGLHGRVGSRRVIELHGSAFRVYCLECGEKYSRDEVQGEMVRLNPAAVVVKEGEGGMIRPDGDVELSQAALTDFKPPFCKICGGILKPDIVFFGDNVPKSRVDEIRALVSASDGLLVLGSTLSVFSGFRIVLQAVEEFKPVGIVNIGKTRADKYANVKISARCGDILPRIL